VDWWIHRKIWLEFWNKLSMNSDNKWVREEKSTLRNIPIDEMCNATLKHPTVKSLWENIVLSSGVDPSSANPEIMLGKHNKTLC
jgi:hypothetical protein